jgi:hypothetical protein
VARAIAPKWVRFWVKALLLKISLVQQEQLPQTKIAKSTPDGYTLSVGHSNSNAIAPFVLTNVPYNPATDFTPITYLGYVPNVLVVKSSLPVDSVSQLHCITLKLTQVR